MEASAVPRVNHGCDSSSCPSSTFLFQGRKILARAGVTSAEPGVETVAVDFGDSDPDDWTGAGMAGASPAETGLGNEPFVQVIAGAGPLEAGAGSNPAVLVITGVPDPHRLVVTITGRDRLEAPCRLIPGLCIVEMRLENMFHI